MTCLGCRESGIRCPFCGRTPEIEHGLSHDIPANLPTSGRDTEK